MGLIKALVDASHRFSKDNRFQKLSVGYDYRPINWIFELGKGPQEEKTWLRIRGKYKNEHIHSVPIRADRSGRVSKNNINNIKPYLFVDNKEYAIGLENNSIVFNEFKKLHYQALSLIKEHRKDWLKYIPEDDIEGTINDLESIIAFLDLPSENRLALITNALDNKTDGPKGQKRKRRRIESKDIIAFSVAHSCFPFDRQTARKIWYKILEQYYTAGSGKCAICEAYQDKPITRIFPFKLRLFGERCSLLSVNTEENKSFMSLGKSQLGNSPICFKCASQADRTLKFLIHIDEKDRNKFIGQHAVILSRDDSMGKQPLRNQIAIFWTKKPVEVKSDKEEQVLLEDLVKKPFESFEELPEKEAPVAAAQCRQLLRAPFSVRRNALTLPDNRFYLAVLSPNKSRLVVREWLEMDIRPVKDNLKKYINAVQIIHPEGLGVWWPPVGGILEALRSYTSVMQKSTEGPRIAALGPDIIRKLIRCMYQGTPPPDALLVRALRCFRVPDPSTEDSGLGREQYKRQLLRRMSMASAMKLILTHGNEEESKAMEQLVTYYDKSSSYKKGAAYNCGRLLAVLEAIQRRASSSSRGVNTTLVDRFYGAASTAPATVFANLINMATKAHLPKLRRDGKELFKVRSQEELLNIGDLLAEICRIIDDAGGFPPPLHPKEQAVFALGFYHQRADLKPTKKK